MSRFRLLSYALTLFLLLSACTKNSSPRLIVVISIDQFRAEYLERFKDLYLPAHSLGKPGGFRYLMEKGAYFRNAHHDHFPLYTAPGHSVLLTGAPPYKTGIIGNDWYDRKMGRKTYCVEDCNFKLIGVKNQSCIASDPAFKPGVSAKNLHASTVGDQLKLATGAHAKVWGLALKDRAAVLLAGHAPDGVLWFDEDTGGWISSTAYFPNGKLPSWVTEWNAKRIPDSYFNSKWELSVSRESLSRLWKSPFDHANSKAKLGTRFPHYLTAGLSEPDKSFYTALTISPFGNEIVFDFAKELITREKMGQDSVPDLLAISLSSNDHAGHQYGPDSPEVLDVAVRTDKLLSNFLIFLDQNIGLDNAIIVLSGDHGVLSNSRLLAEFGFPAGNYDERAICRSVLSDLRREFGPGDWIYGGDPSGPVRYETRSGCVEDSIFLNRELIARRNIPLELIQSSAARSVSRWPGIYSAYSASDILKNRLPQNDIAARLMRSYYPPIGPDVIYIPEAFWSSADYTLGATHGTPYSYDTHVPILMSGAGIAPGDHDERVSTLDIAPTLSGLLHILPPSGSEGRILPVSLKTGR